MADILEEHVPAPRQYSRQVLVNVRVTGVAEDALRKLGMLVKVRRRRHEWSRALRAVANWSPYVILVQSRPNLLWQSMEFARQHHVTTEEVSVLLKHIPFAPPPPTTSVWVVIIPPTQGPTPVNYTVVIIPTTGGNHMHHQCTNPKACKVTGLVPGTTYNVGAFPPALLAPSV